MNDIDYALDTLKAFQGEISQALQTYFDRIKDDPVVGQARHSHQVWELLKEFSLRPSKRLRGSLAIQAYQMFGGKNRKTALDLAVSIELIQNYLLIIDDVMDRSKTRRGRPAIHELLIAELPPTDAVHTSNMLAINIGLVAQHLATQLLLGVAESPVAVVRAAALFQTNVKATGYGQIEDVFNTIGEPPSEEAILQTYALKSSRYTFINPLQTGAVLAGGDDGISQALDKLGLNAGIAFQLRDDVIGLFGDPAKTGKSNLDDLREGKMTILIQYALTNGSSQHKQIIAQALGKADLSEAAGRKARAAVKASGAYDYTMDLAKQYTAQAQKVLEANKSWDEQGRRFLNGLMAYAIEREA